MSLFVVSALLCSLCINCSVTAHDEFNRDEAYSMFASLPAPGEACEQAASVLGAQTQQSCIETISPLFADIAFPVAPQEMGSLGPLALAVLFIYFAAYVVTYYQANGINFEEINYAVATAIPQYGVLYSNLQLLSMLFGMDPWTMIQIQAQAVQFTINSAGRQIAYFIDGQVDTATLAAKDWLNNQPKFPSGWCGSKLCRAGVIALATAVISAVFYGSVQNTAENGGMNTLMMLQSERDWGVFRKGEGKIVGWLPNRAQEYQDYLRTYSDPNDTSPCKERMAVAAAYLDEFFDQVPEHWSEGHEFLIVCATQSDNFVYFAPYEVSFRFPEIFFLPDDTIAEVSASELQLLLDNSPVTVRRRGRLLICNVGDLAVTLSASANLIPYELSPSSDYQLRVEPTLRDITSSLEEYRRWVMEDPYYVPVMALEPAIGNITEVRGNLNLSTDVGQSGIVSVHFPGKAELTATIQAYVDLMGPNWLPP